MKTIIPCFIIVFSFLVSCQKSAVNPASEGLPSGFTSKNLSSFNSATPYNSQENIDMSSLGLQITSCTGEPLQVVGGIYHLDAHGTINNNNLSVLQHANAQNFKLIGMVTGTTYTGSATINESFNTSFTNGKFVETGTQSLMLTTPGGKNNTLLHVDLHETINGKGQLTAYIDNLRLECK
jgi:hypothetical protein